MEISRRTFHKAAAVAAAAVVLPVRSQAGGAVRLGGPVFGKFDDPDAWAQAHRALGYGAAYCPVSINEPSEVKQAYARAAEKAGIVIAEVGAWSNPLSPNEEERRQAIQKNIDALALADEIGAVCAVNIAGSMGDDWAGIHPQKTVRRFIDQVKPRRSFYSLETMPYTLPDSPDCYLEFIKAIDRPQFACHLDPVNMINSPRRYHNTGEFLRDCFKKLGPYIKSCHAKDVIMQNKALVHLDEIRPGLGALDYGVFLQEAAKLPQAAPIMLEHLDTAEEYRLAAEHVRAVGDKVGVNFL